MVQLLYTCRAQQNVGVHSATASNGLRFQAVRVGWTAAEQLRRPGELCHILMTDDW